jgi:hypothetical protein
MSPAPERRRHSRHYGAMEDEKRRIGNPDPQRPPIDHGKTAELANKISAHDEGTHPGRLPARPHSDHQLNFGVPILLFAIVIFLVWFFSR